MSNVAHMVEFDEQGKSRVSVVVAGAVALMLHAGIALSAASTPVKEAPRRIEIALVTPKPPPPPPAPEPIAPEPEQPKPKPKLKPQPIVKQPELPPPPPSNTPPPPVEQPVPVVPGLSFASTVKVGASFAAPVGNTSIGDPNAVRAKPEDVHPYRGGEEWRPARQATISREARVVRDFRARYPRELAEQGVEGEVVLMVEVTSEGRTRGVRVARSSGSRVLDDLAAQAAQRFAWKPAEVDGAAVDSVVRYVYRFEIVAG